MHFSAPASFKTTLRTLGFVVAAFGVSSAQATTVQFQTVLGDFEVNLYDKATPETVANFLAYVNSGAYENVIVHRSAKKNDGVDNFVIQGGGYTYSGSFPLPGIASRRDVDDIDTDGNTNEVLHPDNEPKFSNVRGTIAMAKQDGYPNSATSQWFINVADNSEILDDQNGGFTVFGQVTGNGMAIVDAIAALNRFRMGSFLEIPLRDYTLADSQNNVLVTGDHLVTLNNITVLVSSPDTADGLTPTPNTLVGTTKNSDDDSSGSLGLFGLLLLVGLSFSRRLLLRK